MILCEEAGNFVFDSFPYSWTSLFHSFRPICLKFVYSSVLWTFNKISFHNTLFLFAQVKNYLKFKDSVYFLFFIKKLFLLFKIIKKLILKKFMYFKINTTN